MRLTITAGPISAEYEGDEAFFKEEVSKFIDNFFDKLSSKGIVAQQVSASTGGTGAQTNSPLPKHSTNTVAKLLDVKTGPDLIIAAVAKKVLVDGDETINRQTIISEMKAATSYFKSTYGSNLSSYLDSLTKADKLRLISEGVYGLPAKMREALAPKLDEQ